MVSSLYRGTFFKIRHPLAGPGILLAGGGSLLALFWSSPFPPPPDTIY